MHGADRHDEQTKPAHSDGERSALRRLINRLEIDQATFYALALRGWQLVGGLVSILLISRFLSGELQGYYYTFHSLIGLQIFFELGVCTVVVNFTSHEWAQLRLNDSGEMTGTPQALARLASLARLLFRWYGIACLLFIVTIGPIGALFFKLQRGASDGVEWVSPWIAMTVLSGLAMWVLPFIAMLEGCNQVATVNRFRLMLTMSSHALVWAGLICGLGLWVVVVAVAVRVAFECYLLGVRYRGLFRTLQTQPREQQVHWFAEIWPLQWRTGVQGIAAYFASSVITPVMFHFHGPVTAGQMGMTWTLIFTLQSGALAWVQSRVPQFGVLVSRRDFAELNRVYRRLTALSLLAASAGAVVLWLGIVAAGHAQLQIAQRVLPPLPSGLFLFATVLFVLPCCQQFYVRAHKVEPFLWPNVVLNLLISILVWQLGAEFGPTGAAIAYSSVIAFGSLPWYSIVWMRCRHDQPIDKPRGDLR